MSGRFCVLMIAARVAAALVALRFTVPAARALSHTFRSGGLISMVVGSAWGLAAFLGWWFALRAHNPRERGWIVHIFLGAAIVGGISCLAGFYGPLIFMPQANQGPLLGIFFTGPIGFTVGGILGAIYSWVHPLAARNA